MKGPTDPAVGGGGGGAGGHLRGRQIVTCFVFLKMTVYIKKVPSGTSVSLECSYSCFKEFIRKALPYISHSI